MFWKNNYFSLCLHFLSFSHLYLVLELVLFLFYILAASGKLSKDGWPIPVKSRSTSGWV